MAGIFLVIVVVVQCYFLGSTSADDGSLIAARNSLYSCGIRKRFGVQTIVDGHHAKLGQWPWHAGLYYGEDYKCGGTLIDQRHVLTSAHCVKRVKVDVIRVHLGQHMLGEFSDQVQVKNVSEMFIHEDFSPNRDDIALLVMAEVVQFSEFVIPICLVGPRVAKVEDLYGERGWVVGWGRTKNEMMSKVLKTAEMPVVNYTECVKNDATLFGPFASPGMYCASDLNGTSVCNGDSGGGMYFLAGDHWELRGITSFAGSKEDTNECDSERYVVFSNVVYYFEWIMLKTGGIITKEDVAPRRISEKKCSEYRKLTQKKNNGVCYNARSPHTVAIIDRQQRHILSGSIISEKFVLTKAPNLIDIFDMDVDWDELRVRVGNLPDIDILGEFTHPLYDSDTFRHHIMLLELKTPLKLTSALIPACLATAATENLYDTLQLSGFTGQNSVNSTVNDYYERVGNRVVSTKKCNDSAVSDHWKYVIGEEEFCTSFQAEGGSTWSGIIGGPLQTVNTRSCMYTIIGVTKLILDPRLASNSMTLQSEHINVFSRITHYVDWIEKIVWANEDFEGSGE